MCTLRGSVKAVCRGTVPQNNTNEPRYIWNKQRHHYIITQILITQTPLQVAQCCRISFPRMFVEQTVCLQSEATSSLAPLLAGSSTDLRPSSCFNIKAACFSIYRVVFQQFGADMLIPTRFIFPQCFNVIII